MANKVILLGRLTRDPELRATQSGKSVCGMTIAVDRQQKKDSQSQQTADFINLVVWEKRAEFCKNYLHKGSKIYVEGALRSRSYNAQDGSKRYITEVVINDIEFADSKKGDGGAQEAAGPIEGENLAEEDIPF